MAVRRKRVAAKDAPVARGALGGAATVKGVKATPTQLRTIEACLQEGVELGCSRRVLVAVVMCITQESAAMPIGHGDAAGPDSRGPFQQREPWGPAVQRVDPAGSTRLFLTVDKGPGVRGWRAVHGSLKHAPAPLSRAINKVQISAHPDAYGRWEAEAAKTVDRFLQGTDLAGAETGGAARYDFVAGGDEDWWASTGSLTQDVEWSRWAAGNVLHFVSDRELAAQAPALVMDGDEPWLLGPPEFDGGPLRPVEQVDLQVAVGEWPVMPGAVVDWRGGILDGRWIVAAARRPSLDGPAVDVTLRRPRPARPEPAAEQGASVASSMEAAAGDVGDLEATGRAFTGPYVYGGGHGPPVGSLDPAAGLDCSSSSSAFLHRVDMFDQARAITSGVFATSWGQPGRGSKLTVWANPQHVFIEFHDGAAGVWKRFDTSPHGDGERGPRLRRTTRSTAGFTPRHWPGA